MSIRSRAVALARYAAGYEKGRSTKDPVYQAVVERRGSTPATLYSSCGDLPAWLLMRLGVRGTMVNRAENTGWVPAVNITRVASKSVGGGNPVARASTAADRFKPGDVIVLNATQGTTHTGVVLQHDPEHGRIVTADYGQPGGGIRDDVLSSVRVRGVDRWARQGRSGGEVKVIESVLDLDDALAYAKARGELQPSESAAQWAARLGLPPPTESEVLELSSRVTGAPLLAALVLGGLTGVMVGLSQEMLR